MSATSSLAPGQSLGRSYFDRVYRAARDPWDFETSPYEAEKYAATLQALGDRQFANAFEIGCSIGVLTERLAARCDRLLAVDVCEEPLQRARARCAPHPQVVLQRMAVPQAFPRMALDLVLMSEVGYYWSRSDLARACRKIAAALQPGGLWLLVHWTPAVNDNPLTGDEVHEAVLDFAAGSGQLQPVLSRRDVGARYRLDLLQRLPAQAAPAAA